MSGSKREYRISESIRSIPATRFKEQLMKDVERKIEDLLPLLYAIVDDGRRHNLAQAAATCLEELRNLLGTNYEPETEPL
jgi:hypothetical protein